jgi:cytochrome c peroxidase
MMQVLTQQQQRGYHQFGHSQAAKSCHGHGHFEFSSHSVIPMFRYIGKASSLARVGTVETG